MSKDSSQGGGWERSATLHLHQHLHLIKKRGKCTLLPLSSSMPPQPPQVSTHLECIARRERIARGCGGRQQALQHLSPVQPKRARQVRGPGAKQEGGDEVGAPADHLAAQVPASYAAPLHRMEGDRLVVTQQGF